MALLGYAVFVFVSNKFNLFAVPAKDSIDEDHRRRYFLGLIAGCFVAFASLAAWFMNSSSIIEGLKASFIVGAVSLLFLMVADWFRDFFRGGQLSSSSDISQFDKESPLSSMSENSIDDIESEIYRDDIYQNDSLLTDTEAVQPHLLDSELNALENELSQSQHVQQSSHSENQMSSVHSEFEESKLESYSELQRNHEDELERKLHEHNLVLSEKSKKIDSLENTISNLKNDAADLSKKASRLDHSEAELRSVRHELTSLKARNTETISESKNALEKLQNANIHLQQEVDNALHQKLEFEANSVELQRLMSENEHYTQLGNALEQKDIELRSVKHELTALKTRDEETISLSEKAIKKLQTENKNLRSEVDQVQHLKKELDSRDVDLQKLKSENERQSKKMNDLLEQKDGELRSVLTTRICRVSLNRLNS